MAHRTKVSGTAYEITGGRTKVNGTGYSIAGGKTKVGGTAYDISFFKGVKASELPIGTIVYLMENGVATPFIVVHYGRPSTSYHSSCDGLWLLRQTTDFAHEYCTPSTSNKYNTRRKANYAASTLRTYFDSTYYNTLGSVEKSAIKSVNIPYNKIVEANNGEDPSSEDYESWYETSIANISAKVFALSATELGRSGYPEEGSLLSYFLSGNSDEAKERRAIHNCSWYTRTSLCENMRQQDYSLVWVRYDGVLETIDIRYRGNGCARPAMILKTSALFDPDTMQLVSA